MEFYSNFHFPYPDRDRYTVTGRSDSRVGLQEEEWAEENLKIMQFYV